MVLEYYSALLSGALELLLVGLTSYNHRLVIGSDELHP